MRHFKTSMFGITRGLLLGAMSVSLTACFEEGGGDGFGFMDSASGAQSVPCEISAFSPETDSLKVSSSSSSTTTLAVTPNSPTCAVAYFVNDVRVENHTAAIFDIHGGMLSTGANRIRVELTNDKGSAKREWTVTKNTPPVCGARTPATTSFGMMAGQTQNLLINANDPDGDTMAFDWRLNGQSAPAILAVQLSSAGASQAGFAPAGEQIGSNAVAVLINDGYDTVTCSWNVTVAGNCSITGGSPAGATVKVNNAGATATNFSVSTESAGCPVNWSLNGTPLAGTDSARTILSSAMNTGSNILQATITSGGSTSTRTWTVTKNSLPQCSQNPGNATTQITGVGMPMSLIANFSDNDNDIVTVAWTINGVAAPSAVFSTSSTASSSTGTFTPNSSYIGNAVITAVLSDGTETNSCAWPVRTVPDCSVISSFPTGATKKIASSIPNTTAFSVIPNDGGCSVSWTLNGANIGSGTVLNLSSDNINLVPGAGNTLIATLTNGVNPAVTREWTVNRNIPSTCLSQSPSATGNSMTSVQTLSLSASIGNTDSDSMSYEWQFNGLASPRFGSLTSTSTSASSIFSPTSSNIGTNQNLKLRFNDGYDSGECSWFADITDPATVNITACTPTATSIVLYSEDPASPPNFDVKNFLVSATGPSLTYQWKRAGANISGATASTFSTSSNPSGGWPSGSHALQVVVTDAYNNSQTCNWSVKKNDRPTITSWDITQDGTQISSLASPGPSVLKLNYKETMVFRIHGQDGNAEDLPNIVYRWKIDGNLISPSNPLLTQTTAGDKSSSTATYSPAGDSLQIGPHTVSASIWDGLEERTVSWTVQINRFSDPCNDLDNSGQSNMTCVFSGIAGIGQGLNPESDFASIIWKPTHVFFHTDGNAFISDVNQHGIWYWNRGASTTIFGLNAPANSLTLVAGGSGAGFFGDGLHATRAQLSSPSGSYYDGTSLYIADTSNNRVRVVNASGIITTILGGGSSNTNGAAGTTHAASEPRSVILLDSNTLLVSLRGGHRIKRVDLSSPTFNAYTYAGVGNNTAPTNNNETDPSAGAIVGPWDMMRDGEGNIFIVEDTGCRIRAINHQTSTVRTWLGVDVNPGKMRTIYGGTNTNTCPYPGQLISSPRGATIDIAKGLIIFTATASNRDALMAMNISSSYGTAGSVYKFGSGAAEVTVAQQQVARIAGTGANAGYLGEGNFANLTRVSDPRGVAKDPLTGLYYFADFGNFRLRRLNSSNRTEPVGGNGQARVGNAGNASIDVEADKMNAPRYAIYDRYNHHLYVSDAGNFRIRRIDEYGSAHMAAGTGATGSGAEEEESPLAITMGSPRGMTFIGAVPAQKFAGHIIYADSSNNRIRFWNRGTSAVRYFGVDIPAGTVKTVAGNGSSGNSISGEAVSASLNAPEGVTTDGTNLYFSDLSNHCIKKVDSNGDISQFAGTCGTSGNVAGVAGTGRMRDPAEILYTTFTVDGSTHSGIFITDRYNARIKFMRLSGPIGLANTTVPINEAHDIACGGLKHDDEIGALNAICKDPHGLALVSNGRLCFSNNTFNNVRCVRLSDGKIFTHLGPIQGETQGANNIASHFPGAPYSPLDQNNVIAAIGLGNPSLVSPPLNQLFGKVSAPMGLATDGQNQLFVIENATGLVRKVVLP